LKEIEGNREKENKDFLLKMKKESYVDNVEAKKEEIVNKNADFIDDLKRSGENSRKNNEMRKEFKLNSKIELLEKKNEKKEEKINEIEKKIDLDSSQVSFFRFLNKLGFFSSWRIL